MKLLSELETCQISGGVNLTISSKTYELSTDDITDTNCIDLFVLRIETADWMTINPKASTLMQLLKQQIQTTNCTSSVDTLIDRFFPLREPRTSLVQPSK